MIYKGESNFAFCSYVENCANGKLCIRHLKNTDKDRLKAIDRVPRITNFDYCHRLTNNLLENNGGAEDDLL